MFSCKTIFITGGSGTIGQFIVKKLISTDCKKIIIFSRGEDKQFSMQQCFSDKRIEYVIGDVRDYQRLESVLWNVDYVIHAAAIKHVPISEKNPMEAVETNIIGTNNLILASIRQNVKKVVCLSSDKAVAPSNCMGMTKGISERLVRSSIHPSSMTEIVCVRLGNVLGSRGSVIPLWKKQIKEYGKITVTNEQMTRFIMTYDDVFQLLNHAFNFGKNGEIIVSNMKACNIMDLAKTVCHNFGLESDKAILITGARPGEKLYEELFSQEELPLVYQNNTYYHIGFVNLQTDVSTIPSRSDNVVLLLQKELDIILKTNHIL